MFTRLANKNMYNECLYIVPQARNPHLKWGVYAHHPDVCIFFLLSH